MGGSRDGEQSLPDHYEDLTASSDGNRLCLRKKHYSLIEQAAMRACQYIPQKAFADLLRPLRQMSNLCDIRLDWRQQADLLQAFNVKEASIKYDSTSAFYVLNRTLFPIMPGPLNSSP